MKLSSLPSTDADSALKYATKALKSKKPRLSEEEAVELAHTILTASAPFICAGAIQNIAESEKDYKVSSHLADRAMVQRDFANSYQKSETV